MRKTTNFTLYKIDIMHENYLHFNTKTVGIKISSLSLKCFLPLPSEKDLPSHLFIDSLSFPDSVLLNVLEDVWNEGFIYFRGKYEKSNSPIPLENFFKWIFSYESLFEKECNKCHSLLYI